jgi:hypothetical protein
MLGCGRLLPMTFLLEIYRVSGFDQFKKFNKSVNEVNKNGNSNTR